MKLAVVMVCADMDDYLTWTLPHNRKVLPDALFIVAAPEDDQATAACASRYGAHLVTLPDVRGGGKLVKGRLVAEALRIAHETYQCTWALHTDCDMVFPAGLAGLLKTASETLPEDHVLYSARWGISSVRDIPAVMEEMGSGISVHAVMDTFSARLHDWKDTPPNAQGPFNVGPWGFFQFFNLSYVMRTFDTPYPSKYEGCGGDDADFSWRFQGRFRRLPQPEGALLHLPHGPTQLNWSGRVTPRIPAGPSAALKRKPLSRASTGIYTLICPGTDKRYVEAQKTVMEHFGVPVNYWYDAMEHGHFMDYILSHTEHDVVGFIDSDCVPMDADIVPETISWVSDNSLVGTAQVSNHIPPATNIFAGPAFFFVNRHMWERLGRPSFKPSPGADACESFCYKVSEAGIRYRCLYPAHWESEPLEGAWKLNNYGFYGIGTMFEDRVYHLFQARHNTNLERFEERCRQIIAGEDITAWALSSRNDYKGKIA